MASEFRGEGDTQRGGLGVDEQFAWRRTLWLSAVGATLPLHRRGRDKLGMEDSTRRKGKRKKRDGCEEGKE